MQMVPLVRLLLESSGDVMAENPNEQSNVHWLDFNDAKPNGYYSHRMIDNDDYVDELKKRMAENHVAILQHLWPKGAWEGDEYVVGNAQGSPGRSLKVSCQASRMGVGQDFATGETFGDLIDVWAAAQSVSARGHNFARIVEEIEAFLKDVEPAARSDKREKDLLGEPYTAPFKKRQKAHQELPPPSATYTYTDADNRVIAQVRRYDWIDTETGEAKKTYRPWDAKAAKSGFPETDRPMFNQVGILHEAHVVFVEGEKSANALIAAGIPSTCVMGGSKTKTNKVDWDPISGKHVVIWPDADQTGIEFASRVAEACRYAGAASTAILAPPDGKDEGWDAADAIEEGMDVRAFLSEQTRQPAPTTAPKDVPTQARSVALVDWSTLTGMPPQTEWLVGGTIPLGEPGLIASMGGLGKSYLLLDLCVRVASGDQPSNLPIFGGHVCQQGTAIFISAEDRLRTFHKRIDRLDQDSKKRQEFSSKLLLMALPDQGGASPFLVQEGGQFNTTDFYRTLYDWACSIDDLKLIVIDPLQAFAHVDFNVDPAAGQALCSLLVSLASDTGATVIVAHHMKKPGRDRIQTPLDAREAIRGTTALVDGFRFAYALWPEEEGRARQFCKEINKPYTPFTIVCGAVVKTNDEANQEISIYARAKEGVLVDFTERLAAVKRSQDTLEALVEAVKVAAEAGQPFNKTGGSGLDARKNELPTPLKSFGKHSLERLADKALRDGLLVTTVRPGSSIKSALDVPDGPFALGTGEVVTGAYDAAR